jgi:hypothetical protein
MGWVATPRVARGRMASGQPASSNFDDGVSKMRFLKMGVALLALSTAALVQAAPELRVGTLVKSSDGKTIGRIYAVDKAKDGSESVVILRNDKALHLAPSTLSASESGLTSSLSYADVVKLK